jgi:predicted ATPase
MQLEELRVQNYQSFSDTESLTFKAGFNLIIGQNNSGKSALLRAITANFADDRHRNELKWETTKIPMVKVTYKVSVAIPEFKDWIFMMSPETIIFPVPSHDHASAQLFFESLSQITATLNKYPTVDRFEPEVDPCHELFERADFQNSPSLQLTARNGDITSGFAYNMGESLSLCFWRGWKAKMFYFNAERMGLGEAPYSRQERLTPKADNLPNVLFVLKGERGSLFEKLVIHLREVFPTVGNISVGSNPDNGHLQILVWPTQEMLHLQQAFPLNSSGTGVSQVIAILVAVMTIDQAVIVVDEINSFLHPAAVKTLIRILQTYYPQHQYIISTHAPEVITCCNPSTIHLVQREGYESKVTALDVESVNSFREISENLGISMSDVFAADHVVWVEGPTEEICFRYILDATNEIAVPRGLVFSAVSATGDFLPRRSRQLVFDIYNQLTTATAALPVTTRFSFDSEALTEEEKGELVRNSSGRLSFLPRRHLESYLIDATAINEFIQNRNPDLAATVDTEAVKAKLAQLAGEAPFSIGHWDNDLSDPAP